MANPQKGKEKVLITGGSGLIGSELTDLLLEQGYQVAHLSRSPSKKSRVPVYEWHPSEGKMDVQALEGVHHIIHLAGAGIADKRWTAKRKKILIDSRTLGPELLLNTCKTENVFPKTFLSASGISGYGLMTSDHIFVEEDPLVQEFIGKCVRLWEAAADLFLPHSRVVKLRLGIVLSDDGGALQKLSKPIKMGVGSPLGNGEQWVPWVHHKDVCAAFLHALQNESVYGTYNVVASDHVTNAGLTKATAKALDKKLWAPKVPAFVLKMMFGEMAKLVLKGSRVDNSKFKATGFDFTYDLLPAALEEIF